MSSIFNTTAKLQHVTAIPAGVTTSRGIELLQGYEFFIKCDPHMVKYRALEKQPSPAPTVPADRGLTATSTPKCYEVTDEVHTLPAGLWDAEVLSTYEFINIERGVFVRIRSPMGVLMETVWEIREKADGGLELVEDIVIKCSRLLVSVIKSTCESGYKGIHEKMVKEMVDPAEPAKA